MGAKGLGLSQQVSDFLDELWLSQFGYLERFEYWPRLCLQYLVR